MIRWKDPIDGPIPIPIWSAPNADGDRTITGQVAGYHLNVPTSLLETMPDLSAHRVEPETPRRVFWLGDEAASRAGTAFLVFANEAEARTVLSGYWIEETSADE